ncbi:phosphopantetheine-protein transferase domain [Enterococcus moraviensis]|nr:phosphopantetheine-protein transferase domain [Enterococcus moraviensis]
MSELLLRAILCQQFHLKNNQINIQKTKLGKPYLEGFPNIQFNYSHSGDYIILGISDKKVGIDIEEITPIDLSIAEHYFCSKEYSAIMAEREEHQVETFFSIWCLKESYVKYTGKGMTIPLTSFCFTVRDEVIQFEGKDENMRFELLPISEYYKTAICYQDKERIDSIEERTLQEILRYFDTSKEK